MREILFRGKSKNNGKWVYGDFCQPCNIVWVDDVFSEVRDVYIQEETLGQYTGLKDKNGTKIFEGDIFGDSSRKEIDVVVFEDGCFKLKSYGFIDYCLDGNAYEERWSEVECEPICNFCLEHDEILGNIYDNPELLGGVESGT